MTNKTYFLGGQDLEMLTIKALLVSKGSAYHDKNLGWGAKLSSYQNELKGVLHPVLIELSLDCEAPHNAIIVDHHGENSGYKASSLRQVFDLLQCHTSEWTRYFQLVEANDVGHIAGLKAMGATNDEITSIRKADRAAQGITPEQELEGELAYKNLEIHTNNIHANNLAVITLLHAKTATVADLYAVSKYTHPLLVLSPQEVNFYGSGELISKLNNHFKGGWMGGNLPKTGFWGIRSTLTLAEIKAVIDE
jgi:hypothetical protein